jgi:hypothetical protein
VWRLRIMARVGDAIMENGGLIMEDGWSFQGKLRMEKRGRSCGEEELGRLIFFCCVRGRVGLLLQR